MGRRIKKPKNPPGVTILAPPRVLILAVLERQGVRILERAVYWVGP